MEEGIDTSATSINGETSLDLAKREKYLQCENLINAHNKVFDYISQENFAAFKLIIENKFINVIEFKNSEGQTPLIFSAKQGREDFVELLVNNSANLNKYDDLGKTALDYARDLGYKKCYKILSPVPALDLTSLSRVMPDGKIDSAPWLTSSPSISDDDDSKASDVERPGISPRTNYSVRKGGAAAPGAEL